MSHMTRMSGCLGGHDGGNFFGITSWPSMASKDWILLEAVPKVFMVLSAWWAQMQRTRKPLGHAKVAMAEMGVGDALGAEHARLADPFAEAAV